MEAFDLGVLRPAIFSAIFITGGIGAGIRTLWYRLPWFAIFRRFELVTA